MGRKHSPKGQIVFKKSEKLEAVYAVLPPGSSVDNFATKFKELYPEDWGKIISRYTAHERNTPQGKGHPMPEPTKYLLNMVKNFIARKAKKA
jgi:hypothetical protein